MYSIGTIITAIFAVSAPSHVFGDVLLESQVDSFRAAVVGSDGQIKQVHGKVLNVQVLYVYPSNNSIKYDNIDWKVVAKSSNGEDQALYDFSMVDDSAKPSSMESAQMNQVFQDLQTLLPILSDEFTASSTPKTSNAADQAQLVGVPSQIFDTRPSNDVVDSFPSRRTITGKPSASSPPSPPAPFQPFPNMVPRGRPSRVKRNSDCDAPTFETPKVNDKAHQVNQNVGNTAATGQSANGANVSGAGSTTMKPNGTMNASATAMCGMQMNGTSGTGCGMKDNKGTGSGSTIIASWTAVIVPLCVIVATRVH